MGKSLATAVKLWYTAYIFMKGRETVDLQKSISRNVPMWIAVVFCLIGLVLTIGDLAVGSAFVYIDVATIILYIVVFFYAFVGYDIPHSNLFRYAFLVYAVTYGMIHLAGSTPAPGWLKLAYLAVVVLSTYMAGRMHKKMQSVVILTVVFIILLGIGLASAFCGLLPLLFGAQPGWLGRLMPLNQPVLWAGFGTAYLARFEQHKNAGLAQDAKAPADRTE